MTHPQQDEGCDYLAFEPEDEGDERQGTEEAVEEGGP